MSKDGIKTGQGRTQHDAEDQARAYLLALGIIGSVALVSLVLWGLW
jgi:hypothetical protein